MGGQRAASVDVERIAWVTNVGAPYRHPVWSALSRVVALRVGLLADNEPNRRWTAALPPGVPRLRTRAFALHRGELHLYVLRWTALGGDVDAVILPGWEMPASWQLLIEAKVRRVRTVAFYESSSASHRFGSGPVAWMRNLFFRHVDAVVTVGEASTQAVLGFGVRPDRVVRTDNAVDVAGIQAQAQAFDTQHDAQTFAYVGQLIERKNVDGVIEAFATLPVTARLLVAGEGPEEESLKATAAGLGVADRVDFRGYVPYEKVPELLAEASTLVLASHSEVYGLVVVEALAAGLHVVVSEVCGVYADVRDLPGVFPVQPGVEPLAAAMANSADAWTGPVDQPVVLARTPEAMADAVLQACRVARFN